MPKKTSKITHYLAMWDMLGLECIFNVNKAKAEIEQWEKEKMWLILKEQSPVRSKPDPIPLQHMILRAKVNAQRSYEIYEFNSTMDEEELRNEFDRDPQPIVEWIRENGTKIYSDYVKNQRKIIV